MLQLKSLPKPHPNRTFHKRAPWKHGVGKIHFLFACPYLTLGPSGAVEQKPFPTWHLILYKCMGSGCRFGVLGDNQQYLGKIEAVLWLLVQGEGP